MPRPPAPAAQRVITGTLVALAWERGAPSRLALRTTEDDVALLVPDELAALADLLDLEVEVRGTWSDSAELPTLAVSAFAALDAQDFESEEEWGEEEADGPDDAQDWESTPGDDDEDDWLLDEEEPADLDGDDPDGGDRDGGGPAGAEPRSPGRRGG